jgi:hypothetical protein
LKLPDPGESFEKDLPPTESLLRGMLRRPIGIGSAESADVPDSPFILQVGKRAWILRGNKFSCCMNNNVELEVGKNDEQQLL